jgi:site-specific recombinase XerD
MLFIARELFWVARKLSVYPNLNVTPGQVEAVANEWNEREHRCGRPINEKWTKTRFIQIARQWLRFLGYWCEPAGPIPFRLLLDQYTMWMEDERGLEPSTIQRQIGSLSQFVSWYGEKKQPFDLICITDVDAYLAVCGASGYARVSVNNVATIIRTFMKYAGAKGWCDPSIATAICAPRIYRQENLPAGPSWDRVKVLLASMETDQRCDIRDLPIIMLCAIYGFRETEVARLKLENIDWERNLIAVRRCKRRCSQTYPLAPVVGNAIIRYLREVRPQSSLREVFLTLNPPFRPISRGTIYSLTSRRLAQIGVSTRHIGPHSLRHACASHLMSENFTLKEIGDHLGHRSLASTRIYAKVDLQGLRQVADFDLGGII